MADKRAEYIAEIAKASEAMRELFMYAQQEVAVIRQVKDNLELYASELNSQMGSDDNSRARYMQIFHHGHQKLFGEDHSILLSHMNGHASKAAHAREKLLLAFMKGNDLGHSLNQIH
jgi:hypothetical protein